MLPYRPGRLNSEIFKVSADSGERVFNVHSSILVVQSKPLATLVTRAVTESEREIDLNDWDGDTVERLLDFLYNGNYHVPSTEEPSSTASSVTGVPDQDVSGPIVYTPRTSLSESSASDRSDSTVHEDNRAVTLDRPLTPLWELQEPIHNMGQGQDLRLEEPVDHSQYTTHNHGYILLAHAKVYVLAQHLEVEALQRFSLQRLLAALIPLESLIAGSYLAADIASLLRFVYRNTKSVSESGNEPEPMRRVVSQFTAICFPTLVETPDMVELLREGGDLVIDLLGKVRKRLVDSENRLVGPRTAVLHKDALSLHLETSKCETRIRDLEETVRTEKKGREKAEQSITVLRDLFKAKNSVTPETLQELEADMYRDVNIVTQKQFEAHRGYDIAHWDGREQPEEAKPKSYRILKSTSMRKLWEIAATDFDNVDASIVRLWPMERRANKTIRPVKPLTCSQMAMPISELSRESEISFANGNVQVWAEIVDHAIPRRWVPDLSYDCAVIHLKHFDVYAQTLRGVGHEYIWRNDTVGNLIPTIISRMGWTTGQSVSLYEEAQPDMILHIDTSETFFVTEIDDGDIICFQKSYTTVERLALPDNCCFFDAPDFYTECL